MVQDRSGKPRTVKHVKTALNSQFSLVNGQKRPTHRNLTLRCQVLLFKRVQLFRTIQHHCLYLHFAFDKKEELRTAVMMVSFLYHVINDSSRRAVINDINTLHHTMYVSDKVKNTKMRLYKQGYVLCASVHCFPILSQLCVLRTLSVIRVPIIKL